jgi:outer membrane protein assembly factor BamB
VNFFRWLIVLAALAGLSACEGLGKSNLEPPTPLESFEPSARLKRLWSAEAGGSIDRYSRLAVRLAGDTVYAASGKGVVTAYQAETGKIRWQQELAVPVSGAMGYGSNLALLGTHEGEVIALHYDSGKLAWRTRVSSEVLAPPVATSGIVVVQTVDGSVYGIASEDGKQLWRFQRTVPALSLRGTSGPSIQAGMVVTGFANGTIAGLDIKTGEVRWDAVVARPSGRTELERLVDVDGTPVIAGFRMFAASYQGRLIALDLRNGRILWGRKASTYVPVAADRQNIYVVDAEGAVFALDQATGAERWRQTGLRARFVSAPTLIDQYIAVGDFDGKLHLLMRSNGNFAARTDIDSSAIIARPVSRGDRLFVSDQSGKLVALQVTAN